jgi:circadian clock protein KaiB
MKKKSNKKTTEAFEKTLAGKRDDVYILRLYVAGSTPKSKRAIENVKLFCEEHLADQCSLEIIDIYQQPVLAKGEQIIAAPTLVKKLPLPLRKLIGDLSDTEKILVGLDMKPRKNSQ